MITKTSDYVLADNANANQSNGYLKLCVLPAVLSLTITVLEDQNIMYLPTKVMFIQSSQNVKKIASVTPMKAVAECRTAWHHKQCWKPLNS